MFPLSISFQSPTLNAHHCTRKHSHIQSMSDLQQGYRCLTWSKTLDKTCLCVPAISIAISANSIVISSVLQIVVVLTSFVYRLCLLSSRLIISGCVIPSSTCDKDERQVNSHTSLFELLSSYILACLFILLLSINTCIWVFASLLLL